MSREVAALIYGKKVGSMLRKSVLAYFAERADNDGSRIFASKQTIANEIECSKQSVIKTVKELIAEGILTTNGHRKTSNGYTVIYDINLDAVKALPPSKKAREDMADATLLTGQNVDRSAELSGGVNGVDSARSIPLTQTVHKPSLKPVAKATVALDHSNKPKWHPPDWIPLDAWLGFEEMRKVIRKPMTDRARSMIVRDLEKLGGSPGAILDQSTLNNWQRVFELKAGSNGQRAINNELGATERAVQRAVQDYDSMAGRGECSAPDGLSPIRDCNRPQSRLDRPSGHVRG